MLLVSQVYAGASKNLDNAPIESGGNKIVDISSYRWKTLSRPISSFRGRLNREFAMDRLIWSFSTYPSPPGDHTCDIGCPQKFREFPKGPEWDFDAHAIDLKLA